MAENADVVVIGMGPGGEDLAGRLAEAGLSVVAVERNLVGGECPYWGCVPSKMMIRAADALAEARRIGELGGSSKVVPEWAPVARRIREEATDDWDDTVAVERLEGKGGRVVRGAARITGPRSVEVDGTTYEASRGIVIATGTEPDAPPIEGLREVGYWTNREAIETEEVPGSLVVVGGGAIGAELAQVFSRFGSEVTVVEMTDHLLPPEEPEAGKLLAEVFEREGITVLTGATATSVRQTDGRIVVEIEGGQQVSGERLLVATGRHTELRELGAEAAGLDPEARFVEVDERMRAADGIWAIGDVTGKGLFTHVAVYQARIAAADILGEETEAGDYTALPRVTFTDPEVGSVGLTEAQAGERGIDVRAHVKPVPETARGWIHKAGNDGLIKVVADAERGVLVGATSVGPSGGEVLGMLSLAVHARVPISTLRSMIYAYPTFHRGIEDTLRELGL